MNKNPILVTGSPRSGSTWLGKLLTITPYTAYVDEPFNPTTKHRLGFDIFFKYITDMNGAAYTKPIEQVLRFRPRKLRRKMLSKLTYMTTHQLFELPRPLMKDPIAILSTEWLAHQFNMEVVALIRHPAAVVDSFIKQDWIFYPELFLNQELLVSDWLSPYVDEFMACPHDDKIANIAWVWRILYFVLGEYIKRNPTWIVVTHEALSQNPIEEIQQLYQQLDLPFTEVIQRKIYKYTSASNPVDAPNAQTSHHYRNSSQLVKNWSKRLSPDDVQRIREITEPVASQWYGDADWESHPPYTE